MLRQLFILQLGCGKLIIAAVLGVRMALLAPRLRVWTRTGALYWFCD